MFKRRILTTGLALLMLFAIPAVAFEGYIDDASSYDWNQNPIAKATEFKFMDGVYITIANGWKAATGFLGDVVDTAMDVTKNTNDQMPLAQSAPPQAQKEIRYEYVPRNTTGYPKWRPVLK